MGRGESMLVDDQRFDRKHRRYVIFLDQIKGVKTTESHVRDHVQFLKELEEKGQLELCGPFIDYKGGLTR